VLACAQVGGDLVAYVDLSRTFDAEYAALMGVDLAALLLVRPPSAADALEHIHALIASGGVGVLVVDSLAMFQSLPCDAWLLEQALRMLSGVLAVSPCALLALTSLPYSPEMTRALGFRGSLLAHTATIRLHIAQEAADLQCLVRVPPRQLVLETVTGKFARLPRAVAIVRG
jgi:RecA/RadA recombinase